MKEEDFILKQFGKEDGFKVPEGYFAGLTERVMQQIPSQQEESCHRMKVLPLHRRILRYWSVAAAVAIVFTVGGLWHYLRVERTNSEILAEMPVPDKVQDTVVSPDDEELLLLEEILDYAMVENSEIAYYLTENQ